jgi:hypothetical protein
MRNRLQQRQLKTKRHWRMIGAIATPVFLGLGWGLWLLPARAIQPDHGPLASEDMVTPVQPQQETVNSGIGALALAVGGIFLVLNSRPTHRKADPVNPGNADLRGADLAGADFSGGNFAGADLSGANLYETNLSGADLNGADLNGANLCGANLNGANLSGADLVRANLSGADLTRAALKYADLSGANLRYANLSRADLRYANLSGVDLNCALLSDANFSDANLSEALLLYVNSRVALNLEPFQLEAEPSPFLCNVALPSYFKKPGVNPNRDCNFFPHLLSARYGISLKEAQGIVDEARQHQWD